MHPGSARQVSLIQSPSSTSLLLADGGQDMPSVPASLLLEQSPVRRIQPGERVDAKFAILDHVRKFVRPQAQMLRRVPIRKDDRVIEGDGPLMKIPAGKRGAEIDAIAGGRPAHIVKHIFRKEFLERVANGGRYRVSAGGQRLTLGKADRLGKRGCRSGGSAA